MIFHAQPGVDHTLPEKNLVEDLEEKMQAWREGKRQAHGHHSPSSIQGEWLAIDDQKNNILASLCLASYLAVNWLQKLETKRCVYYAEVISVLMCVCLCVYGIISG